MIYTLKRSKIHQYQTHALSGSRSFPMPVVVKLEHLDKPRGFFVLLLFLGVLFLFGCISHYYLLEASEHLTNKVFKEWIVLCFIHGEHDRDLNYRYLELPFFHGSHLHSEQAPLALSCGCT